ncbi:flavin reductase family protein [Stenotrophomonas sp.]|uniref:flavin reductase family protein n=1 Tax=Stenotrophomonas sp. TaxID=69392 RepID=UPI002FCA2016
MAHGPVHVTAPPAGAAGLEAAALRHVFGQYPTGVAIVAAADAHGQVVAMTINSFTTVSLDPPLVAWCIGARALDRDAFCNAGHLGISLLSSAQQAQARRFADPVLRRAADSAALFDLDGGTPRLTDAVGWLACTVERRLPLGDHVMLVCRVTRLAVQPGEALAYHRSRYTRVDGTRAWT